MKITLDIDLEKFRYSLVGDGYILDEVKELSEYELTNILINRIGMHIESEYAKSKRLGLLDEE